jgi:hypothetical protein
LYGQGVHVVWTADDAAIVPCFLTRVTRYIVSPAKAGEKTEDPMPTPDRLPLPPTSKAYRFVNRDHRIGYVACHASGEPAQGGTFYARCPACEVMLAISPRGTLPRHKAATRS